MGVEEQILLQDILDVVTLGGIKLTVGPTPPSSPKVNDLWIDTT